MEAIALSERLYLKPFKIGYGLFLKPYSGQGLKKNFFFEYSNACAVRSWIIVFYKKNWTLKIFAVFICEINYHLEDHIKKNQQ